MGAVAGRVTGHGGGMDLGTWTKERSDERLEFIIKPLRGKIPEYWYDMLLLSVTGLALVLVPCVLLAACSQYLAAIVLLVGGVSKGQAYQVGWLFSNRQTEIGEALTGLFAYASIYATFVILKG